MPSPSASDHFWSRLPAVLRAIAEAGWLTVAYAALIVVAERTAPVLGPLEFALLVAFGMLVVSVARRTCGLGPLVLLGGAVVGGAAGWLVSSQVRDILLADPLGAVAQHPSGWLGALAVVRGASIAGGAGLAQQAETLLTWALPLVALLWAVALSIAPAGLRDAFSVAALWGSVALIAAGLIGLGLARVEQLRPGIREGRTRRLLRLLVVALGLAVIPLALPVGLLSGLPVAEIFGPIVGPVRFVIGLLALFFGLLAEALVTFLQAFADPSPETLEALRRAALAETIEEAVEPSLLAALIGLALLAAVLVLLAVTLYAVAGWLVDRRAELDEYDLLVSGRLERSFVVPAAGQPPRRQVAPPQRSRRALDAVAAYVAALVELEPHPDLARLSSETPAGHAARLRSAAVPASGELGRLAADYQLVRYGGRKLSALENRRALGRLQRLRRALRHN